MLQKVVWIILVLLSFLNYTLSMVSGVSVQVSGFRNSEERVKTTHLTAGICYLIRLRRKTRSASGGTLKLKPCFVNYCGTQDVKLFKNWLVYQGGSL
jgi:hypothetical protein